MAVPHVAHVSRCGWARKLEAVGWVRGWGQGLGSGGCCARLKGRMKPFRFIATEIIIFTNDLNLFTLVSISSKRADHLICILMDIINSKPIDFSTSPDCFSGPEPFCLHVFII